MTRSIARFLLTLLLVALQASCSTEAGSRPDATVDGGADTSAALDAAPDADASLGPDVGDDTASDLGADLRSDPPVDGGPGADPRVIGRLEGGGGIFLGSATQVQLPAGWIEEELAIEGTATSYEGALPVDGAFELREAATATYRTRIIVRRPDTAASFNGTVVVEWLNVSAGVDASPDFTYLADELLRGGYAWVGVSAQHIAIEGGEALVPVPGGGKPVGLRAQDPERYGALHHPGDAFAYDLYTQVARLLRSDAGVLGELVPEQLLAVGESQSAFMLTTYANGIQPLARQYDGFLIHSRGGGTAPLGVAGAGIDLVSGIIGAPTRLRTDLEVPVLVLQTETDLLFILNYFPARQPDTERIRTWEIAGTAHADAYLLGGAADLLGCTVPINSGPCHFVAKAALRHLASWAGGGAPAPGSPRLEIDASGSDPALVRDLDGIAQGGVRTPHVDVPLDTLSGAPADGGSLACSLFGSTTPLPPERIAELYPSAQAYLEAFTGAAETSIAAGFVLADDRDALLADADPSRVGP